MSLADEIGALTPVSRDRSCRTVQWIKTQPLDAQEQFWSWYDAGNAPTPLYKVLKHHGLPVGPSGFAKCLAEHNLSLIHI